VVVKNKTKRMQWWIVRYLLS